MLGLLFVLVIYAVVLGLHLVVPARWVDGYVIDPKTNRALTLPALLRAPALPPGSTSTICAAPKKYGPLWAQYVKKVPYRIIPFVY